MIGEVGQLLGSAATGGLLGLGGTLASQVMGYVADKAKAKAEREQKAMDYAHELQLADRNAAQAAAASKADRMLARVQGDIQGLAASIADQAAMNATATGWAGQVLLLFRPALTTLLVAGGVWVTVIRAPTGNAIVELASMAVAWWFGSRDYHKRSGGV